MIFKSKQEQFVEQAVSDLLVYGDSDAVWAKIWIRGQQWNLIGTGGVARPIKGILDAEIRAAYEEALEAKEINDLRRAILAEQARDGWPVA